jgi:fatty-acyl-CoA synthase
MREGYASIWESAADSCPDADALVLGERRTSWREFDDRAARFAAALAAHGLGAGSHVALFLHNAPEYLEAHFGTMKLRAVPAGVNFRYRASELAYLLDNADAEALVYHRSLAEHVAAATPGLSRLRLLAEVDDEGLRTVEPTVDRAVGFEPLLAAHDPHGRVPTTGDDHMLWYTGGTTGLPKGVVWRQQPLIDAGLAMTCQVIGAPVPADLDQLRALVRLVHDDGRAPVMLATTPVAHGTAVHQANSALVLGGTVVMLEGARLDGDEVCELIERERVTTFPVIGDVVARRIVHALEDAEARGTPYDISSVRRIHNAGAMVSAPVKDALLSRGTMSFYDSLGSTEATGFGAALATAPGQSATARFRLGHTTRVLTDTGRDAVPGEAGMIATSGTIALGYYKDPERTARTFRTIDGVPYAVNGDWARVETDGTITLLGRGSGCINTGGEKVWPEEVEEVLKEHPAVIDAVVVGVPDAEWGETVGAVVSLRAGAEVADGELAAWVAHTLAGYKQPRIVAVVDEVRRTTVSKADISWAQSVLASLNRV